MHSCLIFRHRSFLPVMMLAAVMRLARWMHQQAKDDDAGDQQQDGDLLRGGHGGAAVAVVMSHCVGLSFKLARKALRLSIAASIWSQTVAKAIGCAS